MTRLHHYSRITLTLRPHAYNNRMTDNNDLTEGVFVIGGGLTAATLGTTSPLSAWSSLIRYGWKWLGEYTGHTYNPDIEIDSENLMLSATFLKDKIIDEGGERAYWDWLSDVSEQVPKKKNMSLINSVVETGCLILTTNYDDLIEKTFPDLDSMTWRDTQKIQQTIRDNTQAVIHIHGSFKSPESIIFDYNDYQKLNDEQTIKRQLESLIVNKTLIFLGVGDGLHDDDLGPKLKEFDEVFKIGKSQHYLLCTRTDSVHLFNKLQKTQTRPLVYGDTFEDLPDYIAKSFPQGSLIRSDKAAQERIEEIMRPIARCAGLTKPAQIAIKPSFVNNRPPRVKDLAQLNEVDEDFERIKDYPNTRGTIIAALPDGGLTTALSLTAREIGIANRLIVQPTVEFVDVLKTLDALGDKNCVIAVDNVSCRSRESLHRLNLVMRRLEKMPQVVHFILGCKDVDLDRILETLDEDQVTSVYLDQIRRSDVYDMSNKFFGTESRETCKQRGDIVLRTIENNNLPHTYSVLCTLFALVSQGRSLIGDLNEIKLLDDLVSFQIKGIVNIAESDSDEADLRYLLAILAQMIIENNGEPVSKNTYIGRISEDYNAFGKKIDTTEALRCFQDAQWVDWQENASPSSLSFFRGCYLSLFSAWAPRKLQPNDSQKKFRTMLSEDLYKYSQIIESMLRLSIQDSSDGDLFVNMLKQCSNDLPKNNIADLPPQAPKIPKNFSNSGEPIDSSRIEKEVAKESNRIGDLLFSMNDVNDHGVSILRNEVSDDSFLPLTLISRFLGFSKFLPMKKYKQDVLHDTFIAWSAPYSVLSNDEELAKEIAKELPKASSADLKRVQRLIAGYIVIWQMRDSFKSHEMDIATAEFIKPTKESEPASFSVGIIGYLLAVHPKDWLKNIDRFLKYNTSAIESSFAQDFLLPLLESLYIQGMDNLGGVFSSADQETLWNIITRLIEDGPIERKLPASVRNGHKQKILAELQSKARRHSSE